MFKTVWSNGNINYFNQQLNKIQMTKYIDKWPNK